MEYFEAPQANPGKDGICSDNDCPCGFPGATIPRGTGYLYISKELVDFRTDVRTAAESQSKLERMRAQTPGIFVMFDPSVSMPILMCEQGAKKRGLDLEVAAADARHWWETGLAPLRATPLAGGGSSRKKEPPPTPRAAASAADAKKDAMKKAGQEKEDTRAAPPNESGFEKAGQDDHKTEPTMMKEPPELPAKVHGKRTDMRPALWLAIANLNIFGLGYWLSGKKLRGLLFLVGGVFLMAAGHLFNASKSPLLWGLLSLALFIGMGLDLWLLLRKKTVNLAPALEKPALLLPALAILVNLVFYGGFFLYRSLGSNLYQAGLTAYEEGDEYGAFGKWYALSRNYKLSLNSRVVEVRQLLGEVGLLINTRNLMEEGQFGAALEEIALFNTLYPNSQKRPEMAELGVDAYLGWAQKLAGQNEFEDGLEKLNSVEVAFPTQAEASQQQLEDTYTRHYLAWGNYLQSQEDFAQAVEEYEYLMLTYPEADEYESAYEGAAQAYADWSVQLTEQDDYEQAVLRLLAVIDTYSNSTAAADATQMLPQVYLDWGKKLSSQNHFLLAMEKVEVTRTLGVSSVLLEDADEEFQKTVLLLARDEGEDGQIVLSEALVQACNGKTPNHPSVGLLIDEPGKSMNCYKVGPAGGTWWSMPSELLATTPGNFRYTVFRKGDIRVVGSCPYTGGATLERLQEVEEVVINLVATGVQVAKKAFYGGYPSACPRVFFFQYSTASIMGDQVSNSTINEWIAQVLK